VSIRTGTARSQHSIAVHAWKHEIEHDQVGIDRASLFDAGDTIFSDRDGIAGDLEAVPKAIGEVWVVLDNQYRRTLVRSRSALGHLRSKRVVVARNAVPPEVVAPYENAHRLVTTGSSAP
jgi:hypothetical protein